MKAWHFLRPMIRTLREIAAALAGIAIVCAVMLAAVNERIW